MRTGTCSARNPAGTSRRLLFLTLALIALGALPVHAAKYAGEFLDIGVGARAVGLGGAMAAHAQSGLDFYWNPAAIGYVGSLEAQGMYADLWDGLANYSVAGLTLPASGAVLGVNYIRLSVPDIQEHPNYADARNRVIDGDTLSIQEYLLATGANPRGLFSDNESALFLTFSKLNRITLDFGWAYFQIPLEIPVGASVKFINQSLAGASGSGVGADFGMQIRTGMQDLIAERWKATLAWGFNYQDATRTAVDWGENNQDAIPPNFRHGFAFIQKLPGKASRFLVSWDTEDRWKRTHHFGAEYQLEGVLALRGGLWDDEWTAGAGLSIWRATVDYAYLARELGNTHRVSLSLRLR
ncbi:MAG: hypothetical protein PHI18_01650 [bacterium]|nr:hypothetical protein [bacterium]